MRLVHFHDENPLPVGRGVREVRHPQLVGREIYIAEFRAPFGCTDNAHVQCTANFRKQHPVLGEEGETGRIRQQPRRFAAEHGHGEGVPRHALFCQVQLRVCDPCAVRREHRAVLGLAPTCQLDRFAVRQDLDVNLSVAEEKILADFERDHAAVRG